jgi:hypothetical protein
LKQTNFPQRPLPNAIEHGAVHVADRNGDELELEVHRREV